MARFLRPDQLRTREAAIPESRVRHDPWDVYASKFHTFERRRQPQNVIDGVLFIGELLKDKIEVFDKNTGTPRFMKRNYRIYSWPEQVPEVGRWVMIVRLGRNDYVIPYNDKGFEKGVRLGAELLEIDDIDDWFTFMNWHDLPQK